MSQIVLVRLEKPQWSYGSALSQTRHCRLDPSSTQHAAYVDEQGVLHYFHFDTAGRGSSELLSFQLQLKGPEPDAVPEPIRQPWSFEFVPGLPGEIMLVQAGSCRILYASLPRQGSDASDVFLFGSHSARVTCLTTNGNIALSGCSEGSLHLWRMADGQLADTAAAEQAGSAITAVDCLGPLMVAAGTAAGSITLYDTASGRLLAVQRLLAGPGPVSCLAAWLDTQLLSAAALAPPGPRVPDGGGVLLGPNVGAPWRGLRQAGAGQREDGGSAPAALLAAAGPSGWLKVYAASLPGPHSWHLLHSSTPGSPTGPITAVAFTPAGDTLAVAGPAAQVLGTDATAVAAAGGQPGAVSLYCVGSSSSTGGAGGTGQQLQLWHQWCLRSLPVSLAVLASSGVLLMTGRQLGAMQVVNLLVTPELGSSLVLKASRPLQDSSTQQQQQQQQQQSALPAGRSLSSSPVQQQHSPAAPASPDRLGGYTALDGVKLDLQQQQQQSSGASAEPAIADAGILPADVLNIAERDLSALAEAIAASDAPRESDLQALLDSLVAEATAALEDEVIGEAAADAADKSADAEVMQREAADAAAAGADAAAGAGANLAWAGLLQQQQQHGTAVHAAGARRHLFDSAEVDTAGHASNTAAGSAAAAAAAAAAGSSTSSEPEGGGAAGAEAVSWFRKPSTLPTLRSWMDKTAVLAAGTAAEGPTALDLEALAEEMQRQAMQQQQQQQQEFEPAAAEAGMAAGFAQQQQAEEGEEEQHVLQADVAAEEDELPCESTFQELQLQQQLLQLQQQQQQQQLLGREQAQAERGSALPSSSSSSSMPVDDRVAQQLVSQQDISAAAAAELQQEEEGKLLGSFAGFNAAVAETAISMHAGEPANATAPPPPAAAADSDEEMEPRPRQLPAALQRPPSALGRPASQLGLLQQQQQQESGAAAGLAAAARAAGAGRLCLPQLARRPPAAWAPAAVYVTPAGTAAAAATTATAGDHLQQQQQWDDEQDQQLVQQQEGCQSRPQQQQQQQQQRVQKRSLGVKERLSLRRAQALQQQQQQQDKENEPTAAAAAAGGSGGVSARGKAAAAAAAVMLPAMPASDHPFASAVVNSTRLLERKMQDAQQPPRVTVGRTGPAVLKLAVQLAELDLPPEQQQYQDLADLKDIPTPTHARKLLPKQLDARWVASRSLKPQLDTLFKPHEWQPGSVAPQVLLLPSWPTPQQVVQQLLWPGLQQD